MKKTTWTNRNKILFRHKGEFSYDIGSSAFEFTSKLVKETKTFCHTKGYDIDRISVIAIYDADLGEPNKSIRSHSESHLQIVETENRQLEARIFMGSQTQIS